jgi:putative peptide zinc metalloprotease protein
MLYAPKLRTNLKVSRQHTNSGTFYILKNPASNEFFRLREAEGFIAHQFDGRTTLDVIRERTEAKFEVNLPIEVLDSFVNNLERTGLLETGKPTPSVQARRVAGSLLYLRFKIFDPARLLNVLIRRASFCFTPFFILLSAAMILATVAVLASNWEECAQELPRLYHASSIALFVVLSFFVVSTHELAHGMTCKHFGGEAHEIGFMLIYLQPALYCNVSDAWLFPEKWKQLSVGFAGPYFELFVWSIAVMAWRLTDGDTWIHDAALIVTTTSGIKTLLNFNPFIKLDGYYLLSDYLEIPNLRRKAFRYVGSFIQRFFGYSAPAGEDLSARERRVFLLYGLVATVSSFLLLAYVIFRTSSLLIEKGQPIALLLSIGFIVLKLRRRFRRLFGKSSNTADPDDDGEALSTSGSGQNHSKSEPRKRTKRPAKKWIPFAFALGAVLALIIFCSVGHMELRVAGAFMILPIENSDVRAVVEGMIDRIYVDEGDEVKAGQLVARLSDRDLRAALQSTETEIRAGAAKLRMLEAGPTSYQVEVAKAVVAEAGDRLKFAQNRETRIKGLFDEHLR